MTVFRHHVTEKFLMMVKSGPFVGLHAVCVRFLNVTKMRGKAKRIALGSPPSKY